MTLISGLLVANLNTYGAPLLGLVLLLGAVGFPLPLSMLVFVAGVFSRQGTISWYYAAGFGLAGTVIGDSLSFAFGRWGGKQVLQRFGSSNLLADAQSTFTQRRAPAIFFTRFLLTAIAVPVNLMAGSSRGFYDFLVYDLAGEAVWIALYGGSGYLFGSQWELISVILSDFGWTILVPAAGAGGLYWVLQKCKWQTTLKMQPVKIPVVKSH